MNVLLGPYNTAGSAQRLAVALRTAGIEATSAAVDHSRGRPLKWHADRELPRHWGSSEFDTYLTYFSHFLLWSGLSIRRQKHWFDEHDLPGPAAVVATGSELRLPLVHKQLEAWSPFGDDPFSQKLVQYSARFHARLKRKPLPVFVHTAGMIDYYPSATWLPIICEPIPHNSRVLVRQRPVVLYAPTNGFLKGAKYVEATDWSGFELRHPSSLMSPLEMEQAIVDSDIVLGGLVLGDYGLTEIQGMAAGRLVIANVGDRVRSKMPEAPPIVHATPDSLAQVLMDVLSDRDRYRDLASRGPEFVHRWHGGAYSVSQLSGFLGLQAVAA